MIYLILLCDASLGMYPDNTNSRFQARLTRRVELLQGAWEVGL
jgi:hypothetical protein